MKFSYLYWTELHNHTFLLPKSVQPFKNRGTDPDYKDVFDIRNFYK